MRHLFGTPRRRGQSRDPLAPARPRLEPLEGRLLPAHVFVPTFTDGPSTPFVGNVAPNLRSAIDHSASGDEIDLSSGAYTLASELRFGHDLLVRGGAGGPSVIDARRNGRVLEVGGAHVTLTGLTLTGGVSASGLGGGILVGPFATLNLMNDSVINNSAAPFSFAQGGGIFNLGRLTVSDSTLTGNTCGGNGGGIANQGTLIVRSSTVSHNFAHQGGGIFNFGTLTVADSTLTNNGSQSGGGIANRLGSLTVRHSLLAGNSATNGGGIANDGALWVSDSTLADNSAFLSGGGIANDGTMTVSDSTLSHNSAFSGGGIGVGVAGALTVLHSSLMGNSAAVGGGINNDGELAICNSTLAGNSATDRGGGIASGVTLTVSNCTLTGNSAAGFGGGGIYNVGALTVLNSTLAGNAAVQGGGLLLAGRSGPALLVNDTIARNTARARTGPPGRGGGLAVTSEPAPPLIWNTLMAGNEADTHPDVDGPVSSLGHSLIGNTAGSTGFTAARGDLLDVPPAQVGLGLLADNGGPTPTLALAPGSLALDHGDDGVLIDPRTHLTTDQRGLPRRFGAHVDIGAFEEQVAPPHHGRRFGN